MKNQHSGNRLRDALKASHIGPASAAARLDVSPQQLNNWFNRGVPARHISGTAKEFGICAVWLESGAVDEPLEGERPVNLESKSEARELAGATESSLLALYRALPRDRQAIAVRLVSALLD